LAIEGAKQKEVLAAASLAYLPEHPAAAAALREALASKDEQFVERLKKTISAQPPRRTRR
jgi:hypothetical protein